MFWVTDCNAKQIFSSIHCIIIPTGQNKVYNRDVFHFRIKYCMSPPTGCYIVIVILITQGSVSHLWYKWQAVLNRVSICLVWWHSNLKNGHFALITVILTACYRYLFPSYFKLFPSRYLFSSCFKKDEKRIISMNFQETEVWRVSMLLTNSLNVVE